MSEQKVDPVEQYITKRGGDANVWFQRMEGPAPAYTAVRIFSWLVIAAFLVYFLIPEPPQPIQLTYELDLAAAPQGSLVVTMIAEGDLPRKLKLEFPPGVFGDDMNGVHPHSAAASELLPDGSAGKPLGVKRTDDGWQVSTGGVDRAGFIYQVDLNHLRGVEEDVRRHISTPVSGGLRMAGFEVFLQPVATEVNDITVTVHNPRNLKVLVPWPALVRKGGQQVVQSRPTPTQQASVSPGQGFMPGQDVAAPTDPDPAKAEVQRPVPSNLFYHPKNLADLNNSLVICGDLQVATTMVRECVIQLATDHQWSFPLDSAMDIVRRIARTEMGFFGTAPTPQITVILAANQVTGQDRFDIYGVHTGSSILVMMDPRTTWGELEDQSASVIAHEMFHGWLGEAIPQRDADMLWFTEGATTWYAARMLTAAGIWKPDHARAVLDARLQRDYRKSRLKSQLSVASAAAEVMAPADQVRFAYAGSVHACVNLDQWLSEKTGKDRPLDLVLRHLYDNRDGSPLTRLAFEAAIYEVTGIDCKEWLDKNVYGKTTLPAAVRLI